MSEREDMHKAIHQYAQTDDCLIAARQGNIIAVATHFWKAAKESSRKELEEAKQRICVLEEVAKTAQDCQRIVERINHEILAEKAALGKKLDEMTGKRNVCARTFDKMKAHAKTLEDSLREVTKHNEELTKLLAAERQAGRDELQQELSEQEPVAEVTPSTDGTGIIGVKWNNRSGAKLMYGDKLIPRPAPPTKKG